MRHIISMSRRVTCNERRKRDRRGRKEGGGGCRKHAMTQTGWRLSEPLLYPAKSTCTEPLRDAHNLVHKTVHLYTSCTLHLFTSCSRNRNNRKRPCWRRKSLRIARGESSLARLFSFRNIYDHFRLYSI